MADRASAVRALSDLVRVAGLASAIGAFFLCGLDGGVKFTLVFLALAIPRFVGSIPAPLDLAYCITLLLATWSATAAWYRAIPWIDWPVHGVTTGSIAAMLYLLMDRWSRADHLGCSPSPQRARDRARHSPMTAGAF